MFKSKIFAILLAAVTIFAMPAPDALAAEPSLSAAPADIASLTALSAPNTDGASLSTATATAPTEPPEAQLSGISAPGANVAESPETAAATDSTKLLTVSTTALDVSYLTPAPGADATQMTFSWHTAAYAEKPKVRIWKDGGAKMEYAGTCSSSVSGLTNLYYNGAAVTGLEPDTAYEYQVGDGKGRWSERHAVRTRNPDAFSYLIVGDPQIGASNTAADTASWLNAMDIMTHYFPDAAFLAGTGDQIETAGTLAHYTGFFSPAQMASMPFASAMGNHEGSGANTRTVYNPPNADGVQNYWYRYGDTLFMVWNCTTGSTTSMRSFLKNAIDANPDAKWKILTFHYDVYGQGSAHSGGLDGTQYGTLYVPVIDEFGIDVVFNGHDHSYNRTFPLYAGECQDSEPEQSVNPEGTVYFSLNSSTGSKYYGLLQKFYYTAAMQQANRPHFSVVDIDSVSFTCTTYQIETTNQITKVDSYTIIKTEETGLPELLVKIDAHLIKAGDYIKVETAFTSEVESNAAALNIGFDTTKFEFRGFSAADGVTLLNTESNDSGVVFTLMAPGYKLKKIGEILLSAKESADLGNADYSVSARVTAVLRLVGGNKVLATGSSASATFSAGDNVPTEISLIDLSNIIDKFGSTNADPDWRNFRIYDINNNGEIDIFDIAYFARLVR